LNINNPTTFSTPALVYSTSNSSGSAGALRADDTLAVFSTTVPTNISTATVSAATGDNAFTSREDHVHGSTAVIAAASESEMVAAESTTVFASPGTTQYHPGVGKAWAKADQTGSQSLRSSYGISGIADAGVGLSTITFTTAFDDTHGYTGSIAVPNGVGTFNNPSTTTMRLDSRTYAGNLQDVDELYCMFMGTQA